MTYTISTEKVNRKGFKILTNGIDFTSNPIIPILVSHNSEQVIGKWNNFSITDKNELVAEPIWDDKDAETLKIKSKIENGFISGLSAGLIIKDFDYLDDGTILVSKSELVEGSITPIPANKDAQIVAELSLSFKDETNTDKIIEMLSVHHNNNEKLIKDKVADAKIINEEDKPKTKTKTKTKKRMTKKKTIVNEDVNEDMLTLADRLIKTFSIEINDTDNKYSKVILSLNEQFKKKDDELKIASDKLLTFETEITELKAELNTVAENMQKSKIEIFIDESIKNGKVDVDEKEHLITLANDNFDTVQRLINARKANKVAEFNLNDNIKDNENAIEKHDFEWYQKNDSNYLKELRDNNKAEYDNLVNEYLKK